MKNSLLKIVTSKKREIKSFFKNDELICLLMLKDGW